MIVRSRSTGDRGTVVEKNGLQFVRLDRGPSSPEVPYRPLDWHEEVDNPPLSRHQLARVAFQADRQLLYFLGKYSKAKRQWEALTDEEKIAWAKSGPATDETRKKMFESIMSVLDHLTRAA